MSTRQKVCQWHAAGATGMHRFWATTLLEVAHGAILHRHPARMRYSRNVNSLRVFLHCLLAILVAIATSNAVLANRFAGDAQMHDATTEQSGVPPCHQADEMPQPVTPGQDPCCNDGLCGCGCLPALAVALASQQAPPGHAIRPVAVPGYMPRALLTASRQPALRPPIG